ncbi:hypothetical protein [Embleya sp. NPDC005971]
MHEQTTREHLSGIAHRLVRNHSPSHLEADIRWLEPTRTTLDRLAAEAPA